MLAVVASSEACFLVEVKEETGLLLLGLYSRTTAEAEELVDYMMMDQDDDSQRTHALEQSATQPKLHPQQPWHTQRQNHAFEPHKIEPWPWRSDVGFVAIAEVDTFLHLQDPPVEAVVEKEEHQVQAQWGHGLLNVANVHQWAAVLGADTFPAVVVEPQACQDEYSPAVVVEEEEVEDD